MAKVTKNLSLDPRAVERGERYSEQHSTSLSQLVSDLLMRLPLSDEKRELPPTVRRLLGAAAGSTDEEDYRGYLTEKYGR